MRKLQLRLAGMLPHHLTVIEMLLVLVLSIVATTGQAYAVTRLQDRSLYLSSSIPSATAQYKVSFTYDTLTTVGSVDLLFCIDPIPYIPCVPPPGLDLSHATLSNQTGETGYSISLQTANHIILSRTPGVVGNTPSSYNFDNVTNPSPATHSFAARLSDYASSDATGTAIDVGSVINQVTDAITLETQVPPMLIFCMAAHVSIDCTDIASESYTDMGTLTPEETLRATSQMSVSTNASSGYVVTINGTTMQAGTHVIDAMKVPTPSAPGTPQFGLNLRANATPEVGVDPDGTSLNSSPTDDYNTPDLFKFKDGDAVATAPNVSLSRRYTMSYIVNSPADLRPGVYTTTLTYVCSGRF